MKNEITKFDRFFFSILYFSWCYQSRKLAITFCRRWKLFFISFYNCKFMTGWAASDIVVCMHVVE